mmetsp:Transcript_4225/g.562  ORF Transcript_4225/g.562 Transcript_4225/m.562 type:complete len:93 (+) Transcript_4225:230-508(+)
MHILNKVLPDDIRILGCETVDDDFDARFSCLYRQYKYFMNVSELDIDAMRNGIERLIGTHDFRNFCKIDLNMKTFVRRIISFELEIVECSGV